MYCPYCGAKNDKNAIFCEKCGRRIEEEFAEEWQERKIPQKGNSVKIMIAILIGVLFIGTRGGIVYWITTQNKETVSASKGRTEQDESKENEEDAQKQEKETDLKEEKEEKEDNLKEKEKDPDKLQKEETYDVEEKEYTAEETDSEYILPQSSSKPLSSSEISSLSLRELNYARNEVFARHGRRFHSAELQRYFNSKSWYSGTISPENFDDNYLSTLNNVEKANVEALKKEEYSRSANGYKLDQ